MVQRKAPDQKKLGIIQPDDTLHKKYVKSTALKSTSSQAEMRNKAGTELKKIMKKSGSFKRSDFETMASHPSRRAKPRLEKPSKTPQKLSQIKTSDGSPPNYMKPTSSFTARKECLQVSPNGSKTGPDLKTHARIKRDENRLKISSGSVKTLTKTSSLKPVRTLTKTSSMKSGRPLMMKNKNSRVALCPNQNVGRATCSTTLKDSKFPKYVMLNPGGTEAEGTSVMKVCPYTYCSLNGHHHAELPPLKRFLSARRRLMKTQKTVRLKSLSPVESKPSDDERNKDFDTGQTVFNGDPAVMEEINLDFFVEIYAPPREENSTESLARFTDSKKEEEKMDSIVNLQGPKDSSFSVEDDEETKMRNHDGSEDDESVPDELSYSELSFVDKLDHNRDLMEVDTKEIQKEAIDDEHRPTFFVQADTDFEGYSFVHELNFEGPAVSELDELKSEVSNMDWEDEQYVASSLDNGADNFPFTDDESDSIISWSLHGFVDSESQQQNIDGEDLKENGEENNGIFDAGSFDGGNSEVNNGAQISEIDMSGDLSSDAFGEPTSIKEGKDGDFKISLVLEEPTASIEETTRTNAQCDSDQQLLKNCRNSYKPNRIKRPNKDSEELRKLNWQEPHFLPVEPDLEAEKVDLKHQMMDEKKNAEEWMLDYALRQTVNKLAPARKRKVALLVEAFEMVAPLPKWEKRLQHTTSSFGHTRFVQACN